MEVSISKILLNIENALVHICTRRALGANGEPSIEKFRAITGKPVNSGSNPRRAEVEPAHDRTRYDTPAALAPRSSEYQVRSTCEAERRQGSHAASGRAIITSTMARCDETVAGSSIFAFPCYEVRHLMVLSSSWRIGPAPTSIPSAGKTEVRGSFDCIGRAAQGDQRSRCSQLGCRSNPWPEKGRFSEG